MQKAGLPAESGSVSIGMMPRLVQILLLLLTLLLVSCRSTDALNRELYAAIRSVNKEAIQRTLESGASPNAMLHEDETPLGLLLHQYKYSHEDRRKRIEDAATLLLEMGAWPNEPHHGFTPLQIAAGQRANLLASRLIAYGANPSLENRAGYAPIWAAVFDNNYKLGQILLQAGANPNAKGPGGQTPLEYLRAQGKQQTRLMIHLRRYGGR